MADLQVVKFTCEVLRNAASTIMDPESTDTERTEAQQFCDEFRANSKLCLTCGLKLVKPSEPNIVRHLGFQLLEHLAKVRWYKVMTADERVYMTRRIMSLISAEMKCVLEEERGVKVNIARIVVEIAKHDWPEHWPKMLMELEAISKKGARQAEVFMLILLRLSEDMVNLENTPSADSHRIKFSSLQEIPKLFSAVQSLLKDYIEIYRHLKNDPMHEMKMINCCVITAALKTLASYLEWTPAWLITAKIVELLFCLLNDSELHLEASVCLIIAIKRIVTSDPPPISTPLLQLFEDFSIPKVSAGEAVTKERYFIMKKQCELLCVVGEQLCRSVDLKLGSAALTNFGRYLQALLNFTTHSSQYLSSQTQSTWRSLFNHKELSNDAQLLAILPRYLIATRTNLVKVGFPSKHNSKSCQYSRFDFTSDEDFYKFSTAYREEQRQTLEAACRLVPRTCFQMASECLKYQMKSSVDPKSTASMEVGLSSTSAQSFLQWEAMTFFIKIIITSLFENIKEDIPVEHGLELLQLLLNYKTKDPLILACVQTNLATLFPFTKYKNECLPQVLQKLLEIVGEVKDPKVQSLQSARKNACLYIKQMCRDNAPFLLANFKIMFTHVTQLLSREQLQLSVLERSTLIDGMVSVINQFKDFEQQRTFLEELLIPFSSFWLSENTERIFSDPDAFINYVGANNVPFKLFKTMDTSTDLNRSKIIHCVAAFLGVMRGIQCPSDFEMAKAGGFVDGFHSNGKPIYRNPCARLVLKLLDNLFLLIRTQNNLYLPSKVAKMSTRVVGGLMAGPLDVRRVKNTSSLDLPRPLLDIYDPPEYETAMERTQGFFGALYDGCYYILGRAGPFLKNNFYAMDNLTNTIITCAFANLENVPDYRLYSILRVFLNPMMHSCPPEYYESLLCPVLSFLTPLHARLSYEWETVENKPLGIKEKTNPKKPNRPIIQHVELRRLTREVLEIIKMSCVSNQVKDTIVIADEPTEVVSASKEVSDVLLCTAESDDDCYESYEKADNSLVGERSEGAVSLSIEDAESDSDDACCAPIEHAETGVHVTAESDDACCAPIEDAETGVYVTAESDDVGSQLSEHEETNINSDCEMAAEVPQTHQLKLTELNSLLKHSHLSRLGICLMKDENLHKTLLLIVFSSLNWEGMPCSMTATCLCWPLLKQVIFEPLPVDCVTHCFSSVLKGILKNCQDDYTFKVLNHLAFQMYEALRPKFSELNRVMKQTLKMNEFILDAFDRKLLNPSRPKPDHSLPDILRSLIFKSIKATSMNRKRKQRTTALPKSVKQVFQKFSPEASAISTAPVPPFKKQKKGPAAHVPDHVLLNPQYPFKKSMDSSFPKKGWRARQRAKGRRDVLPSDRVKAFVRK
ncbi:exportin-5-like isoform X2 [Ambystoma mexicanum]|uniref:exportin-5-like isoform X2 n=1 Tax=Ambystoma mexicanum TaxID=8296 RepID=UPI0037E80DAB